MDSSVWELDDQAWLNLGALGFPGLAGEVTATPAVRVGGHLAVTVLGSFYFEGKNEYAYKVLGMDMPIRQLLGQEEPDWERHLRLDTVADDGSPVEGDLERGLKVLRAAGAALVAEPGFAQWLLEGLAFHIKRTDLVSSELVLKQAERRAEELRQHVETLKELQNFTGEITDEQLSTALQLHASGHSLPDSIEAARKI